ncbi:MAG TPA: stage III sporulation protein AC [Peptococcaceae bacterium]|nr:MAG: Stage III sporulation AC family protein [Clostridia bacterium 41_269]HBT20430.1 stage III sporulation protein AC [Peptococcaceae bacterium]
MGVELVFKIAGIGIITAVLHSILKQFGKEELAHLTTLAGVAVCLLMVIQLLANLFEMVRTIFQLH